MIIAPSGLYLYGRLSHVTLLYGNRGDKLNIEDFLAIKWTGEDSALIEPTRFSPIIADPSILFPEETPDSLWRLAAHSAWGIHLFTSDDGVLWLDKGLIVRNAMRAFLRKIENSYYLYYEKYAPLALPLTILPKRPSWKSTIKARSSQDLKTWSRPTPLLRPDADWTIDSAYGASISNPCLVEYPSGHWRLYYSAGLAHVEDCGFEEPRYIALAEATGTSPLGPFMPREFPILDPVNDNQTGVIGAGSMKVLRLDDGWIGLQNKIYADKAGLSRSALFILRSDDGISWRQARAKPLIEPSSGWRSSHVYACDCRYREADNRFYLYYNARDGWYKTKGRERIGRLVSETITR